MIDALRNTLSAEVIVPGHPACGETRQVWNGFTNRHPAVIARCANAKGVATIEAEDGTYFMAEDITVEQVQEAEHGTYLDSWTVMFRRESGYAPGSGDWFWAKWKADGTFDTTPDGVPLTGRVQGCIDCHADAPGHDFVFSHDRYGRQ